MKKNLLFFTLIFSGLSTHVFAADDEEMSQEAPKKQSDYMTSTESSESKKDSKRTPSKQENFKFGGKSTYQEGPLDSVKKSEYTLKKYDALNYSEPTESSKSKKDSKRTPSKQENFKFGGKSTYQEGPLAKKTLAEMLEGQGPEVKRLVEDARKKYEDSDTVKDSKFAKATSSSEFKKNSTQPLSKQENFKFGGKSTYQEGPLAKKTLEKMLENIKDSNLRSEVEKLRAGYAKKLPERGNGSYMEAKKPSSYKAPELEIETSEDRLNKIKDPGLKSEVEKLRAGYAKKLPERGNGSYIPNQKSDKTGKSDAASTTSQDSESF